MPFDLLSKSALDALHVGEVQTSKRGSKFCLIDFAGENLLWRLSQEPLHSPFDAGVYQGDGTETRLNLDIRLDEESKALFESLDTAFQKLIGPQKSTYHPMLHDDGEYGTRLRIKVSTSGMKATILWSKDKARLGTVKDVDTRGAYLVPVFGFSKVWFMGGMHGVTLELKHAIVSSAGTQEADFDWGMEPDPF